MQTDYYATIIFLDVGHPIANATKINQSMAAAVRAAVIVKAQYHACCKKKKSIPYQRLMRWLNFTGIYKLLLSRILPICFRKRTENPPMFKTGHIAPSSI
jgi:hypothetical protein